MNFLNKKALIALAVLSFSGSMFGYEWIVNNKTSKPVMVRMKLKANNQVYCFLAYPNQPMDFSWGFAYCYDSIMVQPYDKQDAAAYDSKLANLPRGAYGSNSSPRGSAANAQLVQEYFNSKIWHVPSIIYSKNSFDTSKIISAMKEVTKIAEVAGKAAAVSQGVGPDQLKVIDDLDLANKVGGITGLIIEGIEKGACVGRTLDLYSVEMEIPGTKAKEDSFIFVNRTN